MSRILARNFFGSVSLFKLHFCAEERNTIKRSAEFMIAHFGASAFDYFATLKKSQLNALPRRRHDSIGSLRKRDPPEKPDWE